MSWSDDMRCLYCDGRLPLYRKITSGQFCNASHRKAYWLEQERLIMERLQETHNSLPLPHPHHLPVRVPSEPALRHLIPQSLMPSAGTTPEMIAADPLAYEVDVDALAAERPAWEPPLRDGYSVAMADKMAARPTIPYGTVDRLAAIDLQPLAWSAEASPCVLSAYPAAGYELSQAGELAMQLVERIAPHAPSSVIAGEVAAVGTGTRPLSLAISLAVSRSQRFPLFEKLLGIAGPRARPSAGSQSGPRPAPIAVANAPQLPPDAAGVDVPRASLPEAGLRQIPLDCVPLAPGAWSENLGFAEYRSDQEAPRFSRAAPSHVPRLALGPGASYTVTAQAGPAHIAAQVETIATPAAGVSLPQRKAMAARAGASSGEMRAPLWSGLLPLACAAQASPPPADVMAPSLGGSLPQPPATDPLRPVSRLEPLEPTPGADFMAAPPPVNREKLPAPATVSEPRLHVWIHAIDFWKHAPRDLKMLMVAIPVLLGLALHPSLPKLRVAAPQAAAVTPGNLGKAVDVGWRNVRQSMLDRAGVALDEDFRSGLDEWVSKDDATTEWSFDSTGFVRPGPLAIYRPSLRLANYQIQFLGLIDKKALSWVVRAADFNNYYVVKLVVLKPGPLPAIGLTRYAVINGQADERNDAIVPIDAREDMLYRVRLDVRQDTFTLMVQGQMVDTWSEPRLKSGGVGFFSARGEASRVRWLQVTHQYDALGRLCAYLAPYNIPSNNGRLQP